MRQMVSVAVFDRDDPLTLKSVRDALKRFQALVIPCGSAVALREILLQCHLDVVVLSLDKPFEEAFSLLSEIQVRSPQTEVIFVAQFDDEMLRAWMEVIQRGAYEFLPKPPDPDELEHHLVRAAEKHHPVELRKRPPAGSVKDLNAVPRHWTSAAGA
jgi:DNA-binding NtrC family response regulator